MHPHQEESGPTGILIAVLVGALLLMGVAVAAFLFLGATKVTSTSSMPPPASSAPLDPGPAATPEVGEQAPSEN